MSQRQRGSEVALTFLEDGLPLPGSFIKVSSFTVTPRTDLTEEGFLGEKTDDIDIQHHGFDLSWEIQNTDAAAIDFMNRIISREENLEPHPKISIQLLSAYRIPGTVGRTMIFQDVFVKLDEFSASGRKDYTMTRFSAKTRKQNTVNS